MQTPSPQAEVSPGPSPPRTGLGGGVWVALLCRPKGGQRGHAIYVWLCFWSHLFSATRGPSSGRRAWRSSKGAGRAVSAQWDVPGGGGEAWLP